MSSISVHPLDPHDIPFYAIPTPRSTAKPFKLSVIPAGHLSIPGSLFVEGYEGNAELEDYSFLIEKADGQRLIWDLGLRQDLKYDAITKDAAKAYHGEAPTSVANVLSSQNIPLDSITSVFFSHTHFDHVSDISAFPKSVSIVLGPREKEPSTDDLMNEFKVDRSGIDGREVRFLSNDEDQWIDVGCFKGFDYYGDSSLFILSTPGHHPGSISLLALTSLYPCPTYHILAGDAAHHISLLRGATIGTYKAGENPAKKWNSEAEGNKDQSFEQDIERSARTQTSLGRMDQEPNILVWLAHDSSMKSIVQSSPGSIHHLIGDMEEMSKIKRRTEEDFRGKPIVFGLGGRRVELERNMKKAAKQEDADLHAGH
ncbi:Beta-lactamase-like [Phaffia rhodozyma]|uniref:Beta-lactamase-like n=1 Tax=Phaffia rhodozyma TaxID=264483 RepID=A0A0F7SEM7_PHARH|nr:Beta-lactamase-like [Phaffia rhodozyma]